MQEVIAHYAHQRPTARRGRDEFEVAVTEDGTVLVDVYAHSPDKERVTFPSGHEFAVALRGLLYAVRAGK